MKWEPQTIVEFARTAGFVSPELVTATALAIVSSGGIDHYDVAAGAPGAGRYVGLWAIDTDRWPEWTPAELVAPQAAARAAYELTRRHDGFGWSAAWAAGHERPYLAAAATATTMAPYTDRPHDPIGPVIHEAHRIQQRARLAALDTRGGAWPSSMT